MMMVMMLMMMKKIMMIFLTNSLLILEKQHSAKQWTCWTKLGQKNYILTINWQSIREKLAVSILFNSKFVKYKFSII